MGDEWVVIVKYAVPRIVPRIPANSTKQIES